MLLSQQRHRTSGVVTRELPPLSEPPPPISKHHNHQSHNTARTRHVLWHYPLSQTSPPPHKPSLPSVTQSHPRYRHNSTTRCTATTPQPYCHCTATALPPATNHTRVLSTSLTHTAPPLANHTGNRHLAIRHASHCSPYALFTSHRSNIGYITLQVSRWIYHTPALRLLIN